MSDDQVLRDAVAGLGLPPAQTSYLLDRWLDQLLWFERKAAANQRQHRRLRIAALAGGLVLPVLVNAVSDGASPVVRVLSVAVSLVVGFATALESFLRPGDRWLRFRQTSELLRSEWWLFVQLAGDYARFSSVAEAHVHFVARVEGIVTDDVVGFVSVVAASATPPSTDPAAAGQGGTG